MASYEAVADGLAIGTECACDEELGSVVPEIGYALSLAGAYCVEYEPNPAPCIGQVIGGARRCYTATVEAACRSAEEEAGCTQ